MNLDEDDEEAWLTTARPMDFDEDFLGGGDDDLPEEENLVEALEQNAKRAKTQAAVARVGGVPTFGQAALPRVAGSSQAMMQQRLQQPTSVQQQQMLLQQAISGQAGQQAQIAGQALVQHQERLMIEFKHYLTQVGWDRRPDFQKILDKYQASPVQHQQQMCAQLKRKVEQLNQQKIEKHRQDQLMAQQAQQAERVAAMQAKAELEEDGILQASGADNTDVLEVQTMAEEEKQSSQAVFATYQPMKTRYGQDHPESIVESAAMACVEPPDPTYVPKLPRSLLYGERGFADRSIGWDKHEPGALSAAQLEALVYAGQRHCCFTGEKTRSGFFVGDGTGVGKGREIASLILDNFVQGRRRAIWCSISTVLLYDAQRDLCDLGRSNVKLYPLHKVRRFAPLARQALPLCTSLSRARCHACAAVLTPPLLSPLRARQQMPYGELPPEVEDGVMFCTYQSLIAENKQKNRRIDQIVAWAAVRCLSPPSHTRCSSRPPDLTRPALHPFPLPRHALLWPHPPCAAPVSTPSPRPPVASSARRRTSLFSTTTSSPTTAYCRARRAATPRPSTAAWSLTRPTARATSPRAPRRASSSSRFRSCCRARGTMPRRAVPCRAAPCRRRR